MKVIIVGGGIGGLTTALMLHARGIDCELFEQAEGVRELGVGINTLPHAIKELQQLGLLERLDAVAIRTHELIYTNRFGQEVWREPRGIDAGYDVPQFSIHRGRLQGVIHQAVRSRLGESRIHTGHRLGDFKQDEGGVTAWFFDRNGSHRHTVTGRRADRRRRHPFARPLRALSERGLRALERLDAVARRAGLAEIPDRPLDGDRRRDGGEARGLSDRRGRPRGPAADQLGGAGEGGRGRRAAQQGRLVAAGPLRGPDAARAALPDPLRGRQGADRGDAGVLGISDVRPRSAAALVARPGHAARRRRASDVSGRLQRRLAGDPRRALPRRPAGQRRHPRSTRSGSTSRSGCRRPRRSSA